MKKTVVQLFMAILAAIGLLSCGQKIVCMAMPTQGHNAVNTAKHVYGKTKKNQYMPEIEISQSNDVTVSIPNARAYRKFLGMLDEFEGCDSIRLELLEADIKVCLDEILVGHGFKYLYISGGIITAKNPETLDGIPLGDLGIYRVSKVENGVLEHLTLQYAEIILDDQYAGTFPTAEILNNMNCGELVISWEGSKDTELPDSDYIYSILPETERFLKGIYRQNEGDYSYTCYSFHRQGSKDELCAEIVSVKDRKSGGKNYFDVLNVPKERILEIPIGTYINPFHKIWLFDMNFDGLNDIVLWNEDNVYSFYENMVVFLWNPHEQKYEYCETAPRNFDECVTVEEQKTYYFYPDANSGPSIYYIYEYTGGVFVRQSLEIEHQEGRLVYIHCKEGELVKRQEMLFQKEDSTWHAVHEENGILVEDSMAEELVDLECEYFPEFTYIWQHRLR